MPSVCAHNKTMKRSLMAEKKQEEPTNQSKSLTGSDTSDDTEVSPSDTVTMNALSVMVYQL